MAATDRERVSEARFPREATVNNHDAEITLLPRRLKAVEFRIRRFDGGYW